MGEAIASEEMTYPGINIMDGKASSRLARGRRGRNGVKPTINASQYWGSKAKITAIGYGTSDLESAWMDDIRILDRKDKYAQPTGKKRR